MRGTHGARKVDVSGWTLFLIENGKIREIWVSMDTLAQAQQMALCPRDEEELPAIWRVLWLSRLAAATRARSLRLCRSRARARDSRRAR